MSIRAALDRHLRSPPHSKKFSICDSVTFQGGNKTLHSYLKHLMTTGKIAGTVHKSPLTPETVQLLFEKGEFTSAETSDPRALMQTVWFYIFLYFGKRGRENQRAMKKTMLRFCVTGAGEEYFELKTKTNPVRCFQARITLAALKEQKITPMARSSPF